MYGFESNAKGALLFYARGKTIWDNKHWIIAKDIRSKYGSQGQQALPIPGNSSLHYFFHTAPMGSFIPKPGESNHNNGLFYTIINTAAKVRSKKIVKKNIHIKAGVIPTISTMLHANQRDYWLVVRDTINTFYAYLVTTQGIANKPVKSSIGDMIDLRKSFILSQLIFSPPGNTLALTYHNDNTIRLFNFDDKTGKISRPRKLTLKERKYIYKLAFSPSGKKLYALAADNPTKPEYEFLYHFNLLKGERALIASNKSIPKTPNLGFSGLQLAKNGKIYIAQKNYQYLGVINFPEGNKKTCNYTPNSIDLKGRIVQGSLPSFPPFYFRVTEKVGIGIPFKRNIEFAPGQAIIRTKYYKLINDIAEFLKKNPKTSIQITGHTDNVGQFKSNLLLSKKRAQAVAKYLGQKGISTNRIETIGEGSKYPIANNQTPKGRKKNRRIEFFIK